ncbi:hypothetical protein TrRE_jg13138 [Triparma retinervis]|uniref:Secreted protein n=1 Tax=Triparma retinervis TaxID=2557542 RepID=A0A9W7G500_9STRA|nr:hypothetical protein TrRE_jg13138 [Triparma retinervis]
MEGAPRMFPLIVFTLLLDLPTTLLPPTPTVNPGVFPSPHLYYVHSSPSGAESVEAVEEGEVKIAMLLMGIWTEAKLRGKMGQKEEERNCWVRLMGVPR